MSKFTNSGMQLLSLLGITLLCFLAATLLVAMVSFFGVDPAQGAGLYVVQTVTQLVSFLLPVWIVSGMYFKGDRRGFFRLDLGGRAWLMALVGVLAMVLLAPLSDWLGVWNDSWSFGPLDEALRRVQQQTEATTAQLLGGSSVGALLVNLLVVALVPAVCEEVFFRAGIQNLMQRWFTRGTTDNSHWGTHLAVWLTAAIFSLVHGELFSFMPRFAMGVLLGYLYVYGGSIVVNAAAHFVNNAVVVLAYWLVSRGVLGIDPSAPMRLPWLLTACCTLAAVMLVWWFMVVKDDKKMKISR